MTDDEPIALICMPTDTHAPSVPGSTREYCFVCAAEVWASPASRAVAGSGGGELMFLCVECAPGVLATERDPVILLPTPEQLREVREHRL